MMLAFACAVSWVIDGDTFVCSDGRHVRLAGIDAPEIHGCQPGRRCAPGSGKAALHGLIGLAKGQEATCEDVGRSYDRVLAFCSIGGADLSCAMMRAGFAIRRYSFGPAVCNRR
jgi:endonuclease YncB( thermonuclease family)